jgi:hypothetical protein
MWEARFFPCPGGKPVRRKLSIDNPDERRGAREVKISW